MADRAFCEEHRDLLKELKEVRHDMAGLSVSAEVRSEKIASICSTVARIETRLEQALVSNGAQNIDIARLEERVETVAQRVGRNWGIVAGVLSAGAIQLLSLIISKFVG